MHGEGNKRKGSRAKERGGLENIFKFCVLLATLFSLRLWLVSRQAGPYYASTTVTVLTALTIHLFDVRNIYVAFLPVSQRAWRRLFLC